MPAQGGGIQRVLFVGDAPDKKDDHNTIPFIGKPGQYLRRVLRGLDFDCDADAWQTYAIICHPRDKKLTSIEVGFCRPNLTKVIKELKPDVIIPMGQLAVEAVIGAVWKEGVGSMARWAGWRIPSQALNAWVCPTWHPRHLIREDDPVLHRQFKQHLIMALGLADKPWPTGPPNWAANVQCITDPHKAALWLRKAATATTGAITFDYEANMLKPDGPDAQIVSCSVAWGRTEPERCIAFPWHGEAIEAMGDLLRSPIPKIASNIKFEDRWTREEFGYRVRAWVWDTMLAAHVADNRSGITSVKFQGFVRLGVPVWNAHIEPFLKTKKDVRVNAILREIDINDLLLYNGLDSIIEFRVAVVQIKELNYPIPWIII